METGKLSVTIGAIFRGTFRRALDDLKVNTEGFHWTENKRFLESTFMVVGPGYALEELRDWYEEFR